MADPFTPDNLRSGRSRTEPQEDSRAQEAETDDPIMSNPLPVTEKEADDSADTRDRSDAESPEPPSETGRAPEAEEAKDPGPSADAQKEPDAAQEEETTIDDSPVVSGDGGTGDVATGEVYFGDDGASPVVSGDGGTGDVATGEVSVGDGDINIVDDSADHAAADYGDASNISDNEIEEQAIASGDASHDTDIEIEEQAVEEIVEQGGPEEIEGMDDPRSDTSGSDTEGHGGAVDQALSATSGMIDVGAVRPLPQPVSADAKIEIPERELQPESVDLEFGAGVARSGAQGLNTIGDDAQLANIDLQNVAPLETVEIDSGFGEGSGLGPEADMALDDPGALGAELAEPGPEEPDMDDGLLEI